MLFQVISIIHDCVFPFMIIECIALLTSPTFPVTAIPSYAQIRFEHHIASNTCCQVSDNETVEIRLSNFTHSTGAQIRFSV